MSEVYDWGLTLKKSLIFWWCQFGRIRSLADEDGEPVLKALQNELGVMQPN